MTSSGTYAFQPASSDIVLDAFERCGLRASELKQDHLISARRSMNLMLARWANRGVNLWKVDLVSTIAPMGQAQYKVDPAVVSVLDVYRRTYPVGAQSVATLTFTTQLFTSNVTIGYFAPTPNVGTWLGLISPVTVGGLTLQGFYQVASVSGGNITIGAGEPAAATTTVTATVQVALPTSAADPIDISLFPLSRNDYAGIPDKAQMGPPTSFWFDRLLAPTLTLWPVPDASGPYELRYYITRQVQDVSPQAGQTPDIPYRFLESFTAGLAAHLAIKWAPDRAVTLNGYAQECWMEASDEDREKTPLRIMPNAAGYF